MTEMKKPRDLTPEESRRPLRMGDYLKLLEAIAPVVKEAIDDATAPLKKRIAALEARPSLHDAGVGKRKGLRHRPSGFGSRIGLGVQGADMCAARNRCDVALAREARKGFAMLTRRLDGLLRRARSGGVTDQRSPRRNISTAIRPGIRPGFTTARRPVFPSDFELANLRLLFLYSYDGENFVLDGFCIDNVTATNSPIGRGQGRWSG